MWEINNYNQAISFLLSLCLGAIFCAIYDVLRAARKVCINSFFAVTVTDILLWIIYAFFTFVFLLVRTNGEIRGYVLIGEALGFLVFRIAFSRFLLWILQFVFINLAKASRKIHTVMNKFYVFFEQMLFKIKNGMFKIFKSVKKLLKNVSELLYTNKNIADSEKKSNETKTKA